jgi:hypothetical protein
VGEGNRPPQQVATDAFVQSVKTIISWKTLRRRASLWEIIKRDISRLDGQVLARVASHWNALIGDSRGDHNHHRESLIVRFAASTEQLAEITAHIASNATEGGNSPPIVICRQQLLMLIRLALQYGRWDGSGATVTGPALLDLLLRIGDHLDGLAARPVENRRGRPKPRIYTVVFPIFFSLFDFNHRRIPEAAVGRTLRMIREIHPQLAARRPDGAIAIDALLANGMGVPLEVFLSTVFAAYALTSAPGEHGSIDKGKEDNPEDTGLFDLAPERLIGDSTAKIDDVRRVLERLSLTALEFCEQLNSKYQQPETTNFTLFRKYPLLNFGNGFFRVLDRAFLLDKLGDGAYWALRDIVEREAPAGAPRRKAVKRLAGWWGQLSEEYLHRLFRESPAVGHYSQAVSFDGGAELGEADAVLDYGPRVVLFEYKSSVLGPLERHAPSAFGLAHAIFKKFAARRSSGGSARGVPQLAALIRGLVEGRSLGPMEPSKVQMIFPVVVCSERRWAARWFPAF